MCFRPSPVKRNDENQNICDTCGMPVNKDLNTCPYCGDPVSTQEDKDFKVDVPARIL